MSIGEIKNAAIVSSVATSVGRPGRDSVSVLIRPRLKEATQCLTKSVRQWQMTRNHFQAPCAYWLEMTFTDAEIK